ncbi:TIGR02679 domain-containing protein [Paenibacillus ihumii]|uniref:TIGR02679 domain-containing protein n=1 Tax=Paenibacillus ihumii TaxID=687436 RepID=UPI0006D86061|nr:TIGR02679 domain-containing protein [Paenibacillus ihumii]
MIKDSHFAYEDPSDRGKQPDCSEQVTCAKKARNYFSNPGFKRMLEAVWKRYSSLEKVGGHAIVPRASEEECEAINAFFGWYKRPGADIRIPLVKFEQELLGSAFPFTIVELYEVLAGEPLLTKSDRQQLAMQDWQELFITVEAQAMKEGIQFQPTITDWLAGLRDGRIFGYRTLRELWRDSPESASRELTHAARAWNLLLTGNTSLDLDGSEAKVSSIRLPVLAALATGNPHALDRNVPAGRLLFQALRLAGSGKVLVGTEPDSLDLANWTDLADSADSAESDKVPDFPSGIDSLEARGIYRSAGIMDDDISSLVHMYCPWDEKTEPYVLTLRQIEAGRTLSPVSDIFMVENPAVFSTLVDITEALEPARNIKRTEKATEQGDPFRASGPLLLCTSGPASAAVLRLIDRYLQENLLSNYLYYSGDFDVKGIEFGNVLAYRYGNRFKGWRFDEDSYLTGCTINLPNEVVFSNEELFRLSRMGAAWDNSLCARMSDKGRKLFQEQLIVLLSDDWKRAVLGGEMDC